MYIRVILFFYKLHFFYKHQYGFRKKYSTCHATSVLTESIIDVFEKKENVLGIFLDLSKAFYTINHTILSDKLWHYGTYKRLAHQWFNSYLSESKRKQLEYINRIHSNIHTVEYGISQEFILPPLLFLIYVNDFPNCTTSGESIMHADDINIFLKHNLIKIYILKLINSYQILKSG